MTPFDPWLGLLVLIGLAGLVGALLGLISIPRPVVTGICWVVRDVVKVKRVSAHINTDVQMVVPSSRVTLSSTESFAYYGIDSVDAAADLFVIGSVEFGDSGYRTW